MNSRIFATAGIAVILYVLLIAALPTIGVILSPVGAVFLALILGTGVGLVA
ncbi:hypothetical protein AB0876_32150 [Mycobacterium sp. NPDC049093]